ncbi:plastocyanin/azurin family copper-binding protein [Pseudopedobacter beijingensis]|uniref:Plastocyanin/azurin family copper-binding protein n=1 Tax=Pseudopedobacter beijingensis TaxID=1207056 RepID=A0ABW4IBJ7_9SPHI
MKKTTIFLSAIMMIMAACSSNSNKQQEGTTESTTATTQETVEPSSKEAVITLNAGDDMKFDQTLLTVKEGQTVKLTLHHTGEMAKDVMGHNFVLLAVGVSATDFAMKVIGDKATDYIPADTKDIIAHTKLLGGGESDTIEFPAPAKGTYEFLCSFPGHVGLMKGTLIVE